MSQTDRTSYHSQIIDVFSKAWFKYDRKVTAVLRTMGFNSVKQFVDSNRKEQNYYNIVKNLKADPKKGSSGLLSTVKEVMNSNQVRSMIWIENNVQKYQMQKHGQPILEEITTYLQEHVKNLIKIPKVNNAYIQCRESSSFEGSSVLDTKNKYELYIKIEYNSDITYIPKDLSKDKPYQILIADDDGSRERNIYQTITIPIKDIDLNIIYDKKYPELLKALLTEDVLRDAFQFSGPCMFTPARSGELSAGCLGDRTGEFNDMIKEGDLIKYVSFTAGWSTTYTAGSTHPHRQPGSLIETYKVRGFAENTPSNMLREDSCVVPTPDRFKQRYYKNKDHEYRAMCTPCVMNKTCRKSRLASGLADKAELDGKNKVTFINLLKIMSKRFHNNESAEIYFDIDVHAEDFLRMIHNNGPQFVLDRELQPYEEEIMGIYNRYKIPWKEINPIIHEHIGIEYEEN